MSFIEPDKTKIVNEYLQKSTSTEISWEQNERTNPWNVTNVSAFLFYCCPECDNYRETNKEVFIQHAVSSHEKVSKITKNV